MRDTFTAMALPLACATAMAVAVHLVLPWLQTWYEADWAVAVLAASVGASIYIALLLIFARRQIKGMAVTLFSMFPKKENTQ